MTATKSIKSPATRPTAPAPLTSLQNAQELMKEYASISARLAGLQAQIKDLAEPLVKKLEDLKAQLQQWTAGNWDEFGANKMLKTEWGTFGYKAGPKNLVWDLEKTPEGYQDEVAKLVKRFLPTAITVKVDEGKVAKLWDDTPKLSEALAALGAKVEQKDNFTISLAKPKA